MTDEIKTQDAGTADKVKLTLAILIVIAGVTAYYLIPLEYGWMRWGAVVASLVLGAVVLWFSWYGRQFLQFLELARVELRKVVWPTRDETLKTTAVVIAFVAVAGVFFWLLDLVLAWATRTLTGQGS
jgi:preprotein translocase subunit SecE